MTLTKINIYSVYVHDNTFETRGFSQGLPAHRFLEAEDGGTPGNRGGRSWGGGGGGGAETNGGNSGGIIEDGGGCGTSGGRMDGGDGVGKIGGTRDGGAGVIGFGGIGTPPMFGGSGTKGTGGKKMPFRPQRSGARTGNTPAEKTRALPLLEATGRSPLEVAVSAHGCALFDWCWRWTEQDVTNRSRPLASCARWTWNLPRRPVTASFRKTVRPFPSWQRTATRVPAGMAFVASDPECTTEPTTTAAIRGGRACLRPWLAA